MNKKLITALLLITGCSPVAFADTANNAVNPSTINNTVNPSSTNNAGNSSSTNNAVNPSTINNTVNPSSTNNAGNSSSTDNAVNPSTINNTVNSSSTNNAVNPPSTNNAGNPSSTNNTGNSSSTNNTGNSSSTNNAANPSSTNDADNSSSINNAVSSSSTTIQTLPDRGVEDEANRDYLGAISVYQDVLKKYPKRADLWAEIGYLYNKLKQYDDAADAFNHAIAIQPNNKALYIDLSETYSSNNDPQRALDAVNQAIALDPNNINFLKGKVILTNWLDDTQGTKNTYLQILKIDPSDKDALNGLKKIATNNTNNESTPTNNESNNANTSAIAAPIISLATQTSGLPNDGVEAEQNGDYVGAINIYKDALKTQPKRVDLWIEIGNLYNKLKQYNNAANSFEQAIAIQPNNKDLYTSLSETYSANNQPKSALDALNHAIMLDPKNIGYLKGKIVLTNWLNDTEATKATYQQILKINPNDKDALNGLKNLSKQASANSNGTSPTINTAKPNTEAYFVNLSQQYSVAKQPKKALAAIDMALTFDPQNLQNLKAKSELANEVNNLPEARDSYERILAIQPQDHDALLGLGQIDSQLNNLDQAAIDYRRYLSVYPNSPNEWIDFAKIQSWRGDFVLALAALEQYRQRYGITTVYIAEKARILAMADRPRAALTLINPLLAQAPNNFDYLFTKTIALQAYNQPSAALSFVNYLNNEYTNNPDVPDLVNEINTPLRSNFNVSPYFDHTTDPIDKERLNAYGQYFYTPETSFNYGATQEYVRAPIKSGYATATGHTTITTYNSWLGLSSQINPDWFLGGQAGEAETQSGKNIFIYQANANWRPADPWQINLTSSQYVYDYSPQSVYLGIRRLSNEANINWTPDLEYHVTGNFQYNNYSDNNNEVFGSLAPGYALIRTQYVNVDVGLYGSLDSYAHNRGTDGYYSPQLAQVYEGTTTLFIKQSENVGYSISAGAGIQKDNTMSHYEFAGDESLQAIFGIYKDVQLTLSVADSQRQGQPTPSQVVNSGLYNEFSAQAILTKRF